MLGYDATTDEVIYHDAEELSEDLHQGRPRLRADTVVDLTRMLSTIGDAFAASNKFVSVALDEPQRNGKHAPLVVIHGRDSGIGVHKLNSRFGGLSVRSPYSVAKWNCQIRFDIEHQTIVMRAALAVADRHKLPRVADAKEVRIGDLSFATIDVAALGLAFRPVLTAMTSHPLAGLASYSRIMGEIERACRLAFPGYHVALSDTSNGKVGTRE